METIEQRKVSILDLARGALSEEVNVQLQRVAENLLDPNTDWKKARKIQITLEFTTNETREIHHVVASTTTKLVSSKPVTTQIAFGSDENGELCAVELSKSVAGQMNLDGQIEPPATVFVVGKNA